MLRMTDKNKILKMKTKSENDESKGIRCDGITGGFVRPQRFFRMIKIRLNGRFGIYDVYSMRMLLDIKFNILQSKSIWQERRWMGPEVKGQLRAPPSNRPTQEISRASDEKKKNVFLTKTRVPGWMWIIAYLLVRCWTPAREAVVVRVFHFYTRIQAASRYLASRHKPNRAELKFRYSAVACHFVGCVNGRCMHSLPTRTLTHRKRIALKNLWDFGWQIQLYIIDTKLILISRARKHAHYKLCIGTKHRTSSIVFAFTPEHDDNDDVEKMNRIKQAREKKKTSVCTEKNRHRSRCRSAVDAVA